MPTIYALGGVSGVGKTHLRESHWLLSSLPLVDIADMYDKHGASDWKEALELFIEHTIKKLNESRVQSDLVLEAFFSSRQRNALERAVHRHAPGVVFKYIWVPGSREVSLQRVQNDSGDDNNPKRREARLNFIRNVPAREFAARAHESVNQLPEEPAQVIEDVVVSEDKQNDASASPEAQSEDDNSGTEEEADSGAEAALEEGHQDSANDDDNADEDSSMKDTHEMTSPTTTTTTAAAAAAAAAAVGKISRVYEKKADSRAKRSLNF